MSESQTSIPTAAAANKNNTGNAYVFIILRPPLTLHFSVFRSILKSAPNIFFSLFFKSSFFANKGAVAGVFSVVGLIGLVILIALIINIIRRREAKKFDKELFLATQEAAATAPNLNFLDDEDDEPKHNGYSDASHGTYGQPQMDAFMRGPSVGEIYPPYVGNGAGIGAHARNNERVHPNAHYDPYAALQGGSAYPPFVLSPGDTYGGPPGRGNEHGAAIIPSGQPYPQRSPPPDLGRSRSTSTGATQPSTSPYPVDVKATPNYPNPHTEHSTRKVEPPTEAADDDAAYGGYVEDDVEEEVPKRVLKVCYGFFLFLKVPEG